MRIAIAAASLTLFLAGVAEAHTPAAPVGPGLTRVWFYRVFLPNDTPDMPAISMNGNPVGYAIWGTSFYRDVPPGLYHIAVASYGMDVSQAQDIVLPPGQETYVKVSSLPSWENQGSGHFARGTYYVRLTTPRIAALELPQTTFKGGN